MTRNETPHVHWITDDFAGIEVPETTQQFLIEVGLPECIPWTTFEFSPFRCEWPELVIGVDDEYPVLVDATGTVTVAYEDGPWFMNSSVSLLGQAIEQFAAAKVAADGTGAQPFAAFRAALTASDPACFSEPQSVWKTMLEEAAGATEADADPVVAAAP